MLEKGKMLLKRWQKCEIYSFFVHFYPEILKVDSNNAVHLIWCGRRDLNPHESLHWNLKPARLPIPPRPHIMLSPFCHGGDSRGDAYYSDYLRFSVIAYRGLKY